MAELMAAELSPQDLQALSVEDIEQYTGVVSLAFEIHLDRERKRKGLWKDYGAEEQRRHISIKSDRIRRVLENVEGLESVMTPAEILAVKEDALEEVYDIINYAVFCARKIEEGHFHGQR